MPPDVHLTSFYVKFSRPSTALGDRRPGNEAIQFHEDHMLACERV